MVNIDWTEELSQLVHVNVERRIIDATAWLASLPVWYRAAAAGIVQHWRRMLELPVVRAGTPSEWIDDIRQASRLLTPPDTDPAKARGIIEWRHPMDKPADEPIYAVCWADKADGTYLCWTPLVNLHCLGGYNSTQHLATITPLGGAAEKILAYVHSQLAKQQGQRSPRDAGHAEKSEAP